MPDHRRHRGPHPEDARLFAPDWHAELRAATSDLSWLLTRGYASPSATELVGNRYALTARQRLAIARCAAADSAVARRKDHQVRSAELHHQTLWIDGYNVLTTVEAALAGGVILLARDGCFRDLASMHGSYRKVSETVPAIEAFGSLLAEWQVASCRWMLDQPVSNSGRLKKRILETASANDWKNWSVDLVPSPDPLLRDSLEIVASSDSQILDRAARWFNLARETVTRSVPDAWIVELG